MESTDFFHAGTNSGKLKVDSMIFGQVWSKMVINFWVMRAQNQRYLKNEFMNWGDFLTANADYCIWLDWYLSFWVLDIRVLQLYFLFCTVFSHFITMHTVETLNIFKSLLQTLHSCSKLLVDFQHSFCMTQALWSELPCNYQLTKNFYLPHCIL